MVMAPEVVAAGVIYEVGRRVERSVAMHDFAAMVETLAEGLARCVGLAYLDGLEDGGRARFDSEARARRAAAAEEGAREPILGLAATLRGAGASLQQSVTVLALALERYSATRPNGAESAIATFERCGWLSELAELPLEDEDALLALFDGAATDAPETRSEETP